MTRNPSPDVFGEALRLQSLGLSIIPIGANKRPAIAKWKPFQTSAAAESQIHDWFDRRDDLGIGIVLGPVSGDLVARDFDRLDAYERWALVYPPLAYRLPTVETARGRHVYFRADCHTATLNDGELRGEGSYVVAPPSVHPSGCRYRWTVPLKSLEAVPWLTPDEAGFGTAPPSPSNATDRTDSTESILPDLWLSARSVLSVATDLLAGTLPARFGTRRRRLFELARGVRAAPQLEGVPLATLRPLVAEWHRLALPTIRTKPFDETWADFVEAFGNVDPSRCGDAVQEAMTRADAKALPPEALRYDSPLARRLIAVCDELSRVSSDGVFYLSCRKAAIVLGISDHKLTNRCLNMLEADGVLLLIERGGPHNNRANRYRYLWPSGETHR